MADQPTHMRAYWRDEKGYEDALSNYYPELAAGPNLISDALMRLKSAKLTIDTVMAQMAGLRHWVLAGREEEFTDSNFRAIGPKIELPAELTGQ